MTIELIYTFFEGEQIFDEVVVTENDLQDEEALKRTVTELLTDEQAELLCKVSCCLYGCEIEPPEWYINANGKIWFNDHLRPKYGLI